MTTAALSQILGRHVWSELMTTDTKAAEVFYDKVVGWTSEPFGASPMPYTQFKRSGGAGVAGLMQRPDDMNMPPFWAMYIAVPKLEDAVAHVKRPAPREQSSDAEPQIGDASWLELMTSDAPAAMTFYQQLFGWQPSEAMDMGEMGKYQMFNRGDRMIGGMMNKPPEMAQAPPHWAIYFRVPDINAAVERVKANGGTILNGPMEVPGGDWILNGMDPQGASFSLHAKKPA